MNRLNQNKLKEAIYCLIKDKNWRTEFITGKFITGINSRLSAAEYQAYQYFSGPKPFLHTFKKAIVILDF